MGVDNEFTRPLAALSNLHSLTLTCHEMHLSRACVKQLCASLPKLADLKINYFKEGFQGQLQLPGRIVKVTH
ncbi:MAG: hypothetical protein WDW38_010347 [Sanguina aurantia]